MFNRCVAAIRGGGWAASSPQTVAILRSGGASIPPLGRFLAAGVGLGTVAYLTAGFSVDPVWAEAKQAVIAGRSVFSDQSPSRSESDCTPQHRATKYGALRVTGWSESKQNSGSTLLLSDIDGTLTGADVALVLFNTAWEEVFSPGGGALVYNTARPLDSPMTNSGYLQLIEEMYAKGHTPLMVPDILIVGEGTEIYTFGQDGEQPQLDLEWDSRMKRHWDPVAVASVMAPHDEGLWVADVDVNEGDRYRFGITVRSAEKANELMEKIKLELPQDCYRLHVIPMTWLDEGHLLTVLPADGGKAAAAIYVAGKLGFKASQTIWAGDSEGDLPMLGTPFKGIIVANSTPGLRSAVASAPAKLDVLQARGARAHGVVEGLNLFFGAQVE